MQFVVQMRALQAWRASLVILAIAAGAQAETPVPATRARTTYNARDYGAVGDGKAYDSGAINAAIAACAEAGGGTVFISAGHYLCGSIHMQSNIHLYLDMGAELIGAPQDAKLYDAIEEFPSQGTVQGQRVAYQDGGHCYFHNSLIWGENLHDVAITGPGRISGGGLVSGDGLLDKISGFSNFGKATPTPPPTQEGPVTLGNKSIALKLCKNVTLRDFTIFHGGHFAILVTGCDGMTVDNVTLDTNRDGIDIDCCRNTIVSNCRINSPNDDGLCPKSTYALGENRIEENLTITNCQVSGFAEGSLLDGSMKPSKNKNGRIKFGTESSGGYRNITISNCTFRGCRGLALEEVDGGVMENITINNITMMDVPSYAIYVTTGKRNRTGDMTEPSRCRNIVISNVIATNVESNSGIQLMGLPEKPLEGIRLENIRMTFAGGGTKEQGESTPKELGPGYPEPKRLGVMPGYGLFARHVKDLELENIRFDTTSGEFRPALVAIDIAGLEINGLKAPVVPGVPMARLEAVTDETIVNSPALMKEGAVMRSAQASVPPKDETVPTRHVIDAASPKHPGA